MILGYAIAAGALFGAPIGEILSHQIYRHWRRRGDYAAAMDAWRKAWE